MARNRVMCEVNPATGKPVRIFRHPAKALFISPDLIRELPRKDAVESIRRQVFDNFEHLCAKCGASLTFNSMHLHERVWRGRGGEISVENGWPLCFNCHEGKDGEHKRAPQWTK